MGRSQHLESGEECYCIQSQCQCVNNSSSLPLFCPQFCHLWHDGYVFTGCPLRSTQASCVIWAQIHPSQHTHSRDQRGRKGKKRPSHWCLLFAFSALIAASLGSGSWFFFFNCKFTLPPTSSPWIRGETKLSVPGGEDIAQAWPIKASQSSSLNARVRERCSSKPAGMNVRTSTGAPLSQRTQVWKIVGLGGVA